MYKLPHRGGAWRVAEMTVPCHVFLLIVLVCTGDVVLGDTVAGQNRRTCNREVASVPTTNFCGNATTRNVCKNVDNEAQYSQYPQQCTWETNCGCIAKSCTCGDSPCIHKCIDACYPKLECDETVNPVTCKCVVSPETTHVAGTTTNLQKTTSVLPETTHVAGPETTPVPTCHLDKCTEAAGLDNDCCGKKDATRCLAGYQKIEWGPGAIECHTGGYFKTCCVPSLPDFTLQTTTSASSETTAAPPVTTTLSLRTTSARPVSTALPQVTQAVLPKTTPVPKQLPNATTNETSSLQPNMTIKQIPSRKTMDAADAAILAGQVSAAVGAAVAGVVALSAAGAASGAGAIAIIGQVQVLSQFGKIGGGGGALGAFSEGFAWANAELPFSFFPGGNTPVPNSSAADSNATGLRRWLGTARRSLGQRRKVSPLPGQSVEEAESGKDCSNETLSAEEKYDCLGCGLVNGIPLLDKAVVVCGSLIGVFCVRSLLQCIVTRCLKKNPWDALLFPSWEGPLLLLHWFGMMDSLTTTLGRPCPSWIVISCVFIVVGPILFLVYAVWTIRRHMQKGLIEYHPIPSMSWSEMRENVGKAEGVSDKAKALAKFLHTRRHVGEWNQDTKESKFWKFLLKDISQRTWKFCFWILIRKFLFAAIVTLTVGSVNAIANIILQTADASVFFFLSPFSDQMLNLQETFSSFSNLFTMVLAGFPSILGFMPDMFSDTFVIVTASMGTAAAAVGAAVGPILAIIVGPIIMISRCAGGLLDKVRSCIPNVAVPNVAVPSQVGEALGSFRDQLKDSINEMAEENAEELLEVGEDQMDAMAETGLDSKETTLLGLGGAVAGAGFYQGAKALSSDTCGNSEHIPHVAHVKLKLSMDFEKIGREGSAERRAFDHDLVSDMSLTTGLPTEAFHVEKLSPIGFIADIDTCTRTSVDSASSHKLVEDVKASASVDSASSHKLVEDVKVQAVNSKVYDSIIADIQICTQGCANESNLLVVVGDLEDQSKDPKSLLYCGVVTQHVQSLTIVKPMEGEQVADHVHAVSHTHTHTHTHLLTTASARGLPLSSPQQLDKQQDDQYQGPVVSPRQTFQSPSTPARGAGELAALNTKIPDMEESFRSGSLRPKLRYWQEVAQGVLQVETAAIMDGKPSQDLTNLPAGYRLSQKATGTEYEPAVTPTAGLPASLLPRRLWQMPLEPLLDKARVQGPSANIDVAAHKEDIKQAAREIAKSRLAKESKKPGILQTNGVHMKEIDAGRDDHNLAAVADSVVQISNNTITQVQSAIGGIFGLLANGVSSEPAVSSDQSVCEAGHEKEQLGMKSSFVHDEKQFKPSRSSKPYTESHISMRRASFFREKLQMSDKVRHEMNAKVSEILSRDSRVARLSTDLIAARTHLEMSQRQLEQISKKAFRYSDDLEASRRSNCV